MRMKVWVKILIGSVIGAILGWFLPSDNQTVIGALTWLFDMGIRMGRYIVAPVLIFSLAISACELRRERLFLRLIGRSFLVLCASALFVVVAGVLTVRILPAIRIPIVSEDQIPIVTLDLAENITSLFPSNMFAVLVSDGVYLLPACLFALFFGIGLSNTRSFTKPVVEFVDSLSRIFYYIMTIFVEFWGLLLIVLSAYWAFQFRGVLAEGVFLPVIILLGCLSLVLGFFILPLFFYLFRRKENPWNVLKCSFGTAVAGFISGDINFTIPLIIHNLKEDHGVKRKVSAVTIPLFAIFGRAGSAMVAVVSLMVVIQSYTGIAVSFVDMLLICLGGFVISLVLARFPGTGAYTALAVLCLNFGSGFEAGYLLFKPIAFYLIAMGTFLDAMIASFATYVIGKKD